MAATIPRLEAPELYLGFVAPIGVDLDETIDQFDKYFRSSGYNVIQIKVTDIFERIKPFLKPAKRLKSTPLYERYKTHIAYGNQIRSAFEDDAALAAITIYRILAARNIELATEELYQKTVYLVHQFKRKEEIDLFRSIYGRLFFQVSVYSRRSVRVDNLARRFADSDYNANIHSYRSKAEELVQQDEEEHDAEHGQRVSRIFHDGDFIINADINSPSVENQIYRFCDLIFGSNSISPSRIEYGMYIAKAAALRTLDLSRQVGAAIFTENGEIITLGSNEVPRALGGTYWPEDEFDRREYRLRCDSNEKRKIEILTELLEIGGVQNAAKEASSRRFEQSQFMDALEYGRIIHAEMSAITDAARLGRPIVGATLYCTTFPCHMCAKHIVSSGIASVVFLEPYPKSLALELHSDSIDIEGTDRGQYDKFPSVRFTHFYGVSPRRYKEIFERSKRKNKSGVFQEWSDGAKRPIIDIKMPIYAELEKRIIKLFVEKYFKLIDADPAKFI